MDIKIAHKGRILHADIENMPLTYYVPDYPTAAITAISSAFADDPSGTLHTSLLGEVSAIEMLKFFVKRYDEAEVVCFHYGRKHDLPHINAALVEFGLPPLGPKLISDTKDDLVKWRGLPKNQEYLGDLFHTDTPKYSMSQHKWREANRLTREGINLTRVRVEADVLQNIQLRAALLEAGLLKTPREWRS